MNMKYLFMGSRNPSPPPEKSPPYTKPNSIPNLTVTVLLTPHGGLFSGGIFSWHPIHVNNNLRIQIVQPKFTAWKYTVKLRAKAASGGVI